MSDANHHPNIEPVQHKQKLYESLLCLTGKWKKKQTMLFFSCILKQIELSFDNKPGINVNATIQYLQY